MTNKKESNLILKFIRKYRYALLAFLGTVMAVVVYSNAYLNDFRETEGKKGNEALEYKMPQANGQADRGADDNGLDLSDRLNERYWSKVKNPGRLTVLLVGVDRRPGEPSISNTDTLILAQINPQLKQMSFLSIPRDTQVEIPGYGMGKINAAARLGKGLETTEKVLEKLLGQKINGYVLTNFNGFKDVVDTLGGVDIDIEKDMFYVTGDGGEDGIINLKKGKRHLNGTEALQYVRFRNDSLADIGRTERQQKVLKAMAGEVMKLKTIASLPVLIPQLYKTLETNLTMGEIWSASKFFVHYDNIKTVSQTLPGNFTYEDGISYWKVAPEECRAVAKVFFEKGNTRSLFSTAVEVKREYHKKDNTPAVSEQDKKYGNNMTGKVNENDENFDMEKDGFDFEIDETDNKNVNKENVVPKNQQNTNEIIFEIDMTS